MVFDWRLASYDKELAWFAQCIDKGSSAFKANGIPPAFENDTFQIPKSSSTDLASMVTKQNSVHVKSNCKIRRLMLFTATDMIQNPQWIVALCYIYYNS